MEGRHTQSLSEKTVYKGTICRSGMKESTRSSIGRSVNQKAIEQWPEEAGRQNKATTWREAELWKGTPVGSVVTSKEM